MAHQQPTTNGLSLSSADSARRALRRLRRQWIVVAAVPIVAALAAYVVSSQRPAEYSASSTIELAGVDLGSVLLRQDLRAGGPDALSQVATDAQLITLPRVLERASAAIGGSPTPGEIGDAVTVNVVPNTTLVKIAATDESPAKAAEIVNAVRGAFVDVRRATYEAELTAAIAAINEQIEQLPVSGEGSADRATLRARRQRLEAVSSVSTGGVRTVQAAVANDVPTNPSAARDAVLVGITALLAMLAGITVIASLRGQAEEVDDLLRVWELPVLGTVPPARDLRRARGSVATPASVTDALSIARANLKSAVGQDARAIAVVAAVEGEGATTIAIHLARIFATLGSRVLLIDANLRSPALVERLELTAGEGLVELLEGRRELDDVVQSLELGDVVGAGALDVVTGGTSSNNPVGLLERPEAAAVLAQASTRYDLVLVDTPAANDVADARAIAELVDGVLVVARLDHASLRDFSRLRDTLQRSAVPVLGLVVNGAASGSQGSGRVRHSG